MTTRFLFIVIAVALAAVAAEATTIVAVKTRKEIVIGADSKVTDTFGNAIGTTACKIVVSGKLAFGYAGFARDHKTGFDIRKIVLDALSAASSETLSRRVESATAKVVEALTEELRELKRNSEITYREKVEGKVFLRLIFAGFEKKRPALLLRRFRLGLLPDGSTGVVVSSADCGADCEGNYVTRFIGETDAIDGLPEDTRDFWKTGLVPGVRRLVEVEIAARDAYVGPPIDIIRILPSRIVWVQKKPECP